MRFTTLFSVLFILCLDAQATQIQPGQRLTLVLSENRPGGEQAQKSYLDRAFPLAQAQGMQEVTTFKIQKTLLGDAAPEGSGLYLWPSSRAADTARNNPQYLNEIKPLRAQAWKDLRSVDMDIDFPQMLHFDRSKIYTAALVWLEDPAAYARYYEGTQVLRDRLGVKTVLKLAPKRYETIVKGETQPPHFLILLEWLNAADLQVYGNAPEFQQNFADFRKGVQTIEWYQLGFWQ